MRTTLTLDDDLASLLKARARQFGITFKDMVNLHTTTGSHGSVEGPLRFVEAAVVEGEPCPFQVQGGASLRKEARKLQGLGQGVRGRSRLALEPAHPGGEERTLS
ncbi:MAG TPA: hypothetical protein VGG06_08790 [Thermoanaerobaculia bacterium]|jgi:hypothetical protein